jgi:Family of unknown function (DUF6502)
MNRNAKKTAGRRRSAVAPLAHRMDPRANEAIELFVRLLARCGFEPDAVMQQVHRAFELVPRRWVNEAQAAPREISDATHVLTVWFSDPSYLDQAGMPRPLPLRGSEQSLETLVSSINRRLDADEVLAYLLKGRALRRLGSRYVPRARELSLRGVRGPNEFRNLRGLLAMLRTFEHNNRPRRQARGWFEFSAENPRIPKRACRKFDEFVGVRAKRLLYDIDSELRRLELTCKPGEPTVRLGTGVYRFEEDISASEDPIRRRLGITQIARRKHVSRKRRRRP